MVKMVRLVEHQLRQSLKATESAKALIFKKINEGHDDGSLENLYDDLQDIELLLIGAVGKVEVIDEHFTS